MRRTICILLVFAVVLSFCSCSEIFSKKSPKETENNINTTVNNESTQNSGQEKLTETTVSVTENAIINEKVEQTLNEMTLEEKIAQMLVVFYVSDTADDTLLSVIRDIKPGGFILTADNITTYEKTRSFVQALQENSEIPMIISMDQEGGTVQRLLCLEDIKPTKIPDMLSVGNTKNTLLAYDIGKVMAEELRTIGVNVAYAPVVDVLPKKGKSFIGSRAFGNNPQQVAIMATATAKGFEENGVVATYKHFPGHGDTATDSHTELPILQKTKEQLYANELIPYQSAIKNGANIIMIGHIALPKVTGDNTPASLSEIIITDLLKTEMGFDGLVITDALNMGALTNQYTKEEIYIKSVEAGADILLMPDNTVAAIETIKNNISEERINESVRKILKFKFTNLENELILDKSYLGSEEHKKIVSQVN